jgi:hypothetical protein
MTMKKLLIVLILAAPGCSSLRQLPLFSTGSGLPEDTKPDSPSRATPVGGSKLFGLPTSW